MISDNGLASEVYIVKVTPTNVQSEAATMAPRVAVAFFDLYSTYIFVCIEKHVY